MGREGSHCDWLVTHDPTETFLHRRFRAGDLQRSAKDHTWPEGIIFRNLQTKPVMIFQQGRLTPVRCCAGDGVAQ